MVQHTKNGRALGQLLWDSPGFPLMVQKAATVASDTSSHKYQIRAGADIESLSQMKKIFPGAFTGFPFHIVGLGGVTLVHLNQSLAKRQEFA